MMLIYVYSLDEENLEYDHSGIVHDISASKNGYTFSIQTNDESIRCYYPSEPVDLGLYKIRGSFSDDGTIFFVSKMYLCDRDDES